MGGFNVGQLWSALKLDDSEFTAALVRAGGQTKLFSLNLEEMGKSVLGAVTALQKAGYDAQSYIDQLIKIAGYTHDVATINQEFVGVLERVRSRMASGQQDELANYRAMLEAERLRNAQAQESMRVKQDYIGLTRQLRDAELSAIRDTNAGLELEMKFRASRDAERMASEANYDALVKQLRREEADAWEASDKEATEEAARAHEDLFNKQQMFFKALAQVQKETQKTGWEGFANQVESFISNPLKFAGSAVKSFLLEFGPLGVAAGVVGAGLAAVGKELYNITTEAATAARQTANLAAQFGLSWQQTRTLEQEAKIAGINIQTLHIATWHLADALENAGGSGKRITTALAEMGVTGNTAGELLTNFLNKLAAIPDETKRIETAHEIFQRSSFMILPLVKNLDEYQKKVAELGPNLDEHMSQELVKANDNLNNLDNAWKKFKERIAVEAAPTLTVAIQWVTSLLKTDKTPQEKRGFLFGAQSLAGVFNPTLGVAQELANDREEKAVNDRSATWTKAQEITKAYYAAQDKAAQGVSEAWRKSHAETREAMQEQLEETKKTIKELNAELGSRVKPLSEGPEREEKEARLAQAMADQKRLTYSLAAPKVAQINLEEEKRQRLASIDLEMEGVKEKEKAYYAERKIYEGREDLYRERATAEVMDATMALARLKELEEKKLAITLDFNRRIAAAESRLEGTTGQPERQARIAAQAQQAKDAANAAMLSQEQHVQEVMVEMERQTQKEIQAAIDGTVDQASKDLDKRLKKEVDFRKEFDRLMKEARQKETNDRLNSEELEIQGQLAHQTRLMEMERTRVEWQERMGLITTAQKMSLINQIDRAEADLQKKEIQRQIDLLDAESANDANYYSERQKLQNQLDKLADDRAAKDAKSHQQSAELAISAWRRAGRQIERDMQKALSDLAGGIFDILFPKNQDTDRLKDLVNLLHDGFQKLQAYANPKAALEDVIKRIKEAGTLAQANAISIRFFGEQAGPQLAREIRNGTISIDDLNAAMKRATVGLTEYENKTKSVGQKISELFKQVARDVEVAIVKHIIEAGLLQLLKTMHLVKAETKDLGDAISQIIHKIAEVIHLSKKVPSKVPIPGGGGQSPVPGVPGVPGGGGGQAPVPTVPGGGGGDVGGGGGIGGFISSSLFSGITGAVTAVSSVIGNFQMHGMNKSLDLIVNHTLRIFNEVFQQRIDHWSQYGLMYDRVGEIMNRLTEGLGNIFLRLGEVGRLNTGAPLPAAAGDGGLNIYGDVIVQGASVDDIVRELKSKRVVRGMSG